MSMTHKSEGVGVVGCEGGPGAGAGCGIVGVVKLNFRTRSGLIGKLHTPGEAEERRSSVRCIG